MEVDELQWIRLVTCALLPTDGVWGEGEGREEDDDDSFISVHGISLFAGMLPRQAVWKILDVDGCML